MFTSTSSLEQQLYFTLDGKNQRVFTLQDIIDNNIQPSSISWNYSKETNQYTREEKSSMRYEKFYENSTETFSYKNGLTKVNHRRGSEK